MEYQPTPYEKEATDLIQREKIAWEKAMVWVSDDASFSMRDEIDAARKNYFGVFEEPTDKDTELEKLWVPLTEWLVERNVANTDLDTKDVHLRHPQGRDPRVPLVAKLIIFNFLKKMGFGEILNDIVRRLNIDGTIIVKCFKQYSEEFKRNLPTLRIVDTLNGIIDPTAYSIQKVPFIEKSVLNKTEIDRHKDWKHKEDIHYTQGSVPMAVIYERWGKLPLSYITNKETDNDKWVEGYIISSAFQSETGKEEIAIIHKIERNNKNFKPYEECWLKRVPGRFHGRGVPEMTRGLQTWINTVVNIRRQEMLNRLVGKYKIRKGSGITKQMLQSLKTGGAIPVDEMDDIQELQESDVKPSAYREPIDIIGMAEQVTGAKQIPSTPTMEPTTAVLQKGEVRGVANLIQENVGLFLERLFRRQLIPLTIECLQEGEILRITGDPEDLEIIDKAYENYVVNKAKNLSFGSRRRLRERVRKQLDKWGNDRPLKILKYVFDTEYDVDVYVTAERFDPALILRNLNDFLLSYGRLPQADMNVINQVVREYLGTLELPITRKIKPMVAPAVEGTRTPGPSPEPRREVPTQRTEFQRARIEGRLSPAEK